MFKTLALLLLVFGEAQAATTAVQNLSTSKQLATIEKPWSIDFDYRISTNLLDDQGKRPYSHQLDLEYSQKLGAISYGDWGWSLGTSFEGNSDGGNFRNEPGNPHMNDVDLGAHYGQRMFEDSKMVLGVEEALPVGYESQLESYKSALTASGKLASRFLKGRLVLTHKGRVTGIVNTYAESPLSKESNPDNVVTYAFSVSYVFSKVVSATVKAGLRSIHFINNENRMRYTSSETLNYEQKKWGTWLAFVNGTYDDNDSYRFMYQDVSKQIVMVGVSFEI